MTQNKNNTDSEKLGSPVSTKIVNGGGLYSTTEQLRTQLLKNKSSTFIRDFKKLIQSYDKQ